MSTLVDILRKKIVPGDTPDSERKRVLVIELTRLNQQQANVAYTIIKAYKKNRDTTRRVGDSESSIPYYGIETQEGIEMSLNMMPDELVLILEELVKSIE